MVSSLAVGAVSALLRPIDALGPVREVGERLADLGESGSKVGVGERIAEAEGWSAYGMMDSADEVLGVERIDNTPLTGSHGETTANVSAEEAAIYEEAGLSPVDVNGRECLVRDDIDPGQLDAMGRSNLERMQDGLAPLDASGQSIELHHVQQQNDGVLAELTHAEHQGAGNNEVLHDKTGPSEIDRDGFTDVRVEHWQARAHEMEQEHTRETSADPSEAEEGGECEVGDSRGGNADA